MKFVLCLLAIFLVVQHYECVQAFFKDGKKFYIGKVTQDGKGVPMGRFRFAVENRNSNRTTKMTFFVVNEISVKIRRKSNAWKVTGVRKTNLDAGNYTKYEDYLVGVLEDLDTSRPFEDTRPVLKTVHDHISVYI